MKKSKQKKTLSFPLKALKGLGVFIFSGTYFILILFMGIIYEVYAKDPTRFQTTETGSLILSIGKGVSFIIFISIILELTWYWQNRASKASTSTTKKWTVAMGALVLRIALFLLLMVASLAIGAAGGGR